MLPINLIPLKLVSLSGPTIGDSGGVTRTQARRRATLGDSGVLVPNPETLDQASAGYLEK